MNKTIVFQEDHVAANQEELIIEHIVNSIRPLLSGTLCAIDECCETLFYEYLNLSPIDRSAFSYNWPYVVQATRGYGFYYQTKQSIVYFYFRKSTNILQPYTLIVVNHLGYDSETSVQEISEAAKKLNISTIIKNIDKDKISLWENLGFNETSAPWSPYSFRDDNTNPEFVYDIKKFINIDFSRRTKEIIRKLSRESNYIFVPFNDSHKNCGLKLLEKNSEYLESKGVDFKIEVMRAHQFVFDENISNKNVMAILEDNRLIGLSFITHVGDNLFFNAIINENKSNLMRFLLWKSVAHYCEGLEEEKRPLYLALQGSENDGQTKWKVFFNPIRTIERTHLTNKSETI